MQINYRWMVTPEELFECFVPVHTNTTSVHLPTVGFSSAAKRPLPGTSFQYQLGVSPTSTAAEIKPVVQAYPDLPITGDSRSGVIVYDGHWIVGAYIIPSQVTLRQIVVRKEYQGKGLAKRMLEQFMREIPGVTEIPKQPINIRAVKAFLGAHKNLVGWAVATGKPVPQRVRDAVSKGEQEAAILKSLELAEKSPAPMMLRR